MMKKFECKKCHSIITSEERPLKCLCGHAEFNELNSEEEANYWAVRGYMERIGINKFKDERDYFKENGHYKVLDPSNNFRELSPDEVKKIPEGQKSNYSIEKLTGYFGVTEELRDKILDDIEKSHEQDKEETAVVKKKVAVEAKLKEGYEPEQIEAFELFSGKLKTAQNFIKKQPLHYDEAGLWWVWKFESKSWKMVDEVEITNLLMSVRIETINSKERSEIIQALKQVSRANRPKDMPKTWIQFKDKIFDISNGSERDATPEYFAVNPIPYSLHPNKFIETPNMDRIFAQWVGEKYIKILYEILAYCLIPDYPIHRLFCFIGGGMNGKSKYLGIVEKFIGQSNVCSTELDTLLNSRFEVTRLHKKLVCIMGETNFNELSRTSMLKKLTGQDIIGFEYKNKNPFEEKNYAKILISTNNLPETTDKTIGFYRRWTIIDFPNQFSEEKDILAEIPEEEYMALATKCVTLILPDLLKNRRFTNEGSLEERQKNYEDKSNPFDKFWKENIDHSDPNAYIPKWEFQKKFEEWCIENRFRKMTDKFITQKMNEKEISEIKPYIQWFSKEESKFISKQVRSWGAIKWKV